MNTVLIVALILVLLALIAVLTRTTRLKNEAITRLLKEEQAIVEEERRMFSFLHDLGEAIAREDSQTAMYRLIVEGAMKVMGSTGGALYLLDGTERCLVPRHHSDKCVPLVALPERIVKSGIGRIDENVDDLRAMQILIDGHKEHQYLLQIFMKENSQLLKDRESGPFFYELIQRKGDKGFGGGNFKALFESIERAQAAERAAGR